MASQLPRRAAFLGPLRAAPWAATTGALASLCRPLSGRLERLCSPCKPPLWACWAVGGLPALSRLPCFLFALSRGGLAAGPHSVPTRAKIRGISVSRAVFPSCALSSPLPCPSSFSFPLLLPLVLQRSPPAAPPLLRSPRWPGRPFPAPGQASHPHVTHCLLRAIRSPMPAPYRLSL